MIPLFTHLSFITPSLIRTLHFSPASPSHLNHIYTRFFIDIVGFLSSFSFPTVIVIVLITLVDSNFFVGDDDDDGDSDNDDEGGGREGGREGGGERIGEDDFVHSPPV